MITEHINFPPTAPRMSASEKSRLRQEIAEQTAAFEAAGGQVRQFDLGAGREALEWTWAQVRQPKNRYSGHQIKPLAAP